MSITEKIYLKNELNLSGDEYTFFVYNNKMLVPCEMEQNDDSVVLRFDLNGTESFDNISAKSRVEKLRCLINCSEFSDLRKMYSFSLNPSNLVYDMNLYPMAVERSTFRRNDDFLNEYKALIASVLYPKYSYDDYYFGGKDLFRKKKLLKEISFCGSIEEIRALLTEAYSEEEHDIRENKKLISKRKVIASRIAIPVLSLITVFVCVVGYILMFIEIPYRDNVISANNAYISEDYLAVQNSMSDIGIENIKKNEKYILSRSYVITESLTEEQKKHILSGITLKTDERVMCYWIEIGRLNFDEAIDYAQRIGDDELLLFALIKKTAYVKSNTSITGEEKTELLNSLESQIKELTEQFQTEE